MKRHIIATFWILTLLCSCSNETKTSDQPTGALDSAGVASSDSEAGESTLGDYVRFPVSGVKIRQPEGFEKADSFDGFGIPGTVTALVAVSLPGPYSKVTAGFTQKQMKAQGWTLRSRQDVRIDDLPGILVHFEQPAGGQLFLKWSLAFGDDQKTTMVTATSPKAQERELSARLKAAVLSTRLDQTTPGVPGAGLSFAFTASSKLRVAPSISRTIAYTKDGVSPARSPEDPLFIAAPALGEVVAKNRRQFAEQGLRQTSQTKRVAVKSTDAIAIAGLEGYESLAEAKDAKSGTPLTVYQVILFDDGPSRHILMHGRVGTGLRDEYLPEFKAMARSLKRKP